MANACMDCGMESVRRKNASRLLNPPTVEKWMVCDDCRKKLVDVRLAKNVTKEPEMDAGKIVGEIEKTNVLYLKRVGKKLTVVKVEQALLEREVFVVTKLGSSDNLDGFHGNVPHVLIDIMQDNAWSLYSMPLNPRKGYEIPHKDWSIGWANEDAASRVLFFEAIQDHLPDAIVKDGKILFVKTEKPSKYHAAAKDAGWTFQFTERTDKRRVKLLRGISIYAKFPLASVTYTFVDSDDSKLIDGGNAISEEFLNRIITEVCANSVNDKDAYKIIARMMRTRQYNGRIQLPMACRKPGQGKGDFFVVKGMKENIRFSSPSIKKELMNSGGDIIIALEPNGGKEKAYMNSQHVVVNPAAFGLGENVDLTQAVSYKKWFKNGLKKIMDDLVSDKVHGDIRDLLEALEKGKVERSNTVADHFKLAEYYKATGTVRSLPSLLFRVTKNHLAKMVNVKDLDLRIEIPNSVYGNLVSQSLANKILGVDIVVSEGASQYLPEWKVLVISDKDFIHNYENFGGNDSDDKFCLMWRSQKGSVVVYCHRNPSGRGEKAVFTFEGKLPKCVDVSDLDELGEMPPSLTEMGPIKTLEKAAPVAPRPYEFEDFLRSTKNESESVGVLVNCVRLRDMSYEGRNEFCVSTETMIDVTAVKNRKMTALIYKDVFDMVMSLVNDKNAKIDVRLWPRVRGIFKSQKEFDTLTASLEADGRFHESWFNRFLLMMEKDVEEFIGEISDEIDAGRKFVDFGEVANALPENAIKMVKDRFQSMVRLFWYLERDDKGRVLNSVWDKIRVGQEKHMNELKAQFVVWGLDPELQLFAALGKEATKLPFKDEHILLRKGVWDSYMRVVATVTAIASV